MKYNKEHLKTLETILNIFNKKNVDIKNIKFIESRNSYNFNFSEFNFEVSGMAYNNAAIMQKSGLIKKIIWSGLCSIELQMN